MSSGHPFLMKSMSYAILEVGINMIYGKEKDYDNKSIQLSTLDTRHSNNKHNTRHSTHRGTADPEINTKTALTHTLLEL